MLTCFYSIFFIEFNLDIYINEALLTMLVKKQDVLYWVNIYNFLHYIFLKWIRLALFNLTFYIIQFYIIIIHNHIYPKYVNNIYLNYMKYKKSIQVWYTFLKKRIIKPRKYVRMLYRFYYIDYLKIILLILSITLFMLMWKRKTTYLKRKIFLYLVNFYILSILISTILVHLIPNSFIMIMLSLLISYLIVFLKLN